MEDHNNASNRILQFEESTETLEHASGTILH